MREVESHLEPDKRGTKERDKHVPSNAAFLRETLIGG